MKRQTTLQRPMTIKRVTQALDANVAAGYLEWYGVDDNGDPLYHVTEKGRLRAKEILEETAGHE